MRCDVCGGFADCGNDANCRRCGAHLCLSCQVPTFDYGGPFCPQCAEEKEMEDDDV